MKRVLVSEFGDESALKLEEAPVPEPDEGQVRVAVKAAGVNYADIMQRRGLYPGGPQPPYVAGFEVAGVIDTAGSGVDGWQPGQRVMCMCNSGYAEFTVVDAASLLPVPEGLDFEQAAAIPCQYLTAYHALVTLGQVRKGQTVLVHAAAGGLGLFMVQICKARGAHVIGTASTAEKCALIKEYGGDHAVNYREEDFEAAVYELTGGQGCGLVVESVGGKVFDTSLRCVKQRGHMIVLGIASGRVRTVDASTLLFANLTLSGFHLFAYLRDAGAMARAMDDLSAWLKGGQLRVAVGHRFPLEQAAEAHRRISARETHGKVVLKVAQ